MISFSAALSCCGLHYSVRVKVKKYQCNFVGQKGLLFITGVGMYEAQLTLSNQTLSVGHHSELT